jgi:hypothetical protein
LWNENGLLALFPEGEGMVDFFGIGQGPTRTIMNMLPVDRALAIYGAIANRSELKGTRERLSKHLSKVFSGGERDPHRLTVHGLTYLQKLDRERDA